MRAYLKRRKLRIMVTWFTGIILYLFASLLTGNITHPGSVIACPIQCIMGTVFSGIFVVIALIAGWPLSFSKIRKHWNNSNRYVWILISIGVILTFFSQPLGLTEELYYADGTTFIGPSSNSILIGYFLISFSIVNWPYKTTN